MVAFNFDVHVHLEAGQVVGKHGLLLMEPLLHLIPLQVKLHPELLQLLEGVGQFVFMLLQLLTFYSPLHLGIHFQLLTDLQICHVLLEPLHLLRQALQRQVEAVKNRLKVRHHDVLQVLDGQELRV